MNNYVKKYKFATSYKKYALWSKISLQPIMIAFCYGSYKLVFILNKKISRVLNT